MSPGRALLLPGLLLLVSVGTLLTGALTPRDLSLGEAAATTGTGDLAAFDLSRGVTGLALFASLAVVVVSAVRDGLPRDGMRIWLAYLGLLATNAVLPGLFGAVPGVDGRAFFAPLVFTAVYLARPMETEDLVALVKGVLLAFLYGSLAVALLAPAQGLARGYQGVIPGLDVRLYGVAGGATSLGAQAAAYLAVEWFSPSRGRLRPLHLAVAAMVLLLTQAKTSWLFLVLCGLYAAWRRFRAHLAASGTRAPSVARLEVVLAGAALLVAGGVATAYLGRLEVADLQGGQGLQTLSGRTYIWATSIGVWLDAPVFGYGPSLWATEAFRERFGSFGHAHNQFIQALAAGGVVGLAGLVHYLRAGFRLALRAARGATPVPLVLLAQLTVLSTMDVPLQGLYLLDAFVVVHLLLFAMLVHLERAEAAEAWAAAPAQPPR